MAAMEKMAVKSDKIKKKKSKRGVRKKIEEVARRMIEWEADEAMCREVIYHDFTTHGFIHMHIPANAI